MMPQCVEAGIIYTLVDYPGVQNGHTLSGTIMTDGTIGSLNTANITAWDFTITGPNPMANSSATSDALVITNTLIASESQIVLNPGSGLVLGNLPIPRLRYDWTSIARFDYEAFDVVGDPASRAWIYSEDSRDEPWVIARAQQVIPEPGSLLIWLAVCGCVVANFRRRSNVGLA
jgi:hypothetical protein